MVQRTQVVLVDDIDGGTAEETVSFALDGVSYEIDLSAENAAALREAFAHWVGHGRRVAGGRGGRSTGRRAGGSSGGGSGSGGSSGGSSRASSSDSAAIRDWAREHGFTVNERGRIPAEVKAAYDAR